MENSIQIRKQLRKYYKNKRDIMPLGLVNQLSARISGNILQWELYQRAETLFFYYPLGNEVSLLTVVKEALAQGRHIAFPKVCGDDMEFYEITNLNQLKEGCFHVMEPLAEGRKPVDWEPELCFLPGTAFDKTGGRFGYGRGYYDRYLAEKSAGRLVGCAYECQVADQLPLGSWDKRVEYLASENGIRYIGFSE